MFDKTIQIYTTSKCDMCCSHCSSKLQTFPDMSLSIFAKILNKLEELNINRIELFANNPSLHPEFSKQIDLLNESGIEYALCVVGDSIVNKNFQKEFLKSVLKIDREKGGLVFSVDYTERTSNLILKDKDNPLSSYAFKANTFWKLLPFLKDNNLSVRTNTVITNNNINEVIRILEKIVFNKIAVSFCFIQNQDIAFKDLILNRSNILESVKKLERVNNFIIDNSNLNELEVHKIIGKLSNILSNNETNYFNKFRGENVFESLLTKRELNNLRKQLLNLKNKYKDYVLPNKEFIIDIGERGIGCVNLLKQVRFPQIKIGTSGEIIFCCDLHDPITMQYKIFDFPEKQKEFIDKVISNPYIWLCTYFNPCDFSVNSVKYETKK